MHLYGSTDGTRFGVDGKTETDIYIPDGFEMKSSTDWDGKVKKDVLKQTPTPTQAVVTFYCSSTLAKAMRFQRKTLVCFR